MANLLDKAIAFVAPRIAAGRAAARAEIDGIARATALYDGASRSFRTAGRRISNTSANTEILQSLGRLRDVSRDLRRNNALAHNAVSVITAHVVGAGIIPTIEAPQKRVVERVRRLMRQHLETTAIDAEGRHNLYGLQKLIIDTVVESGEALIVRQTVAGLKVPLQVRVYEADYLDPRINGPVGNGNMVFQGIEVDPSGRRVAYHLFTDHPGGGLSWQLPVSRRVPADEVIHVYRVDRPGQMRGIPWCAPVVMPLWDLADFEDAELVRQKIAACFAIFLKGGVATTLADQNDKLRTRNNTVIDRLEPGIVQQLPQGVEPFSAVPPISNGYADYIASQRHKIAAGYGIPYELLTTDNKEVSFISGRLGLMQFNRVVDQWRWLMMIPHACDGIGRWFLEAAAIALGTDLSHLTMKHTPPRREMIEPSREVPAIRDAIRSGLTSRDEELRSLGHDPEVIDTEIAAGNARADTLKLGLDSDGRRPLAFKVEGTDDGKDASAE